MEQQDNQKNNYVLIFFEKFEKTITIVVSIIICAIVVIAAIRVSEKFISLFVRDFFNPEIITYEDYQEIFGKIMTLLISLEFLSSILKVLKTHEIRTLILDVCLITALAIVRKLIIFDYDHHQPVDVFALGGLLLSIGVFYFLIRYERK